jgi:hypothetical protein
MAQPRQIGTTGGRKLGKERNIVQNVVHEVTKQENRKALITVGMFVVSDVLSIRESNKLMVEIGWRCILSQLTR